MSRRPVPKILRNNPCFKEPSMPDRIPPSEIDSATRGLAIQSMSQDYLIKTRNAHAAIDLYSSRVIVLACDQEMAHRTAVDTSA
tara:strand:+ start:462 stop:713 length:252 start_codon:yes stop_codon:yes gene_type:complete